MKKLTAKRQRWLTRHARRLVEKRRLRVIIKNTTNSLKLISRFADGRPIVTLHKDKHREYAILIGKAELAPIELTLGRSNWNKTIEFIKSVRDKIDNPRISITQKRINGFRFPIKLVNYYYDFTTIQKVSVTAALILTSEYDRARILRQYNPNAIDIDKWDRHVAWQLNAIGFLQLAGVDRQQESTVDIYGTRLLRMRRGGTADGDIIANYLGELGIDIYSEDVKGATLYEALIEAVTNSVQHAYRRKDLCLPETVPYWWIAASLSHEEGKRHLIVVIYDQGASIPATIGDWSKADQLLSAIRRSLPLGEEPTLGNPRYDGDTIRLAIEIGRTSTNEAYRGKGLNQIVNALDLCESGTVNIFSRKGAFSLTKGEEARCQTREAALIGTLIKWDLILRG